MLGLIVLLIVGFVIWKLSTPGLAFVPAFATLLERPAGQSGALHFIRGTETIGGQCHGRTVLLVLHHKRGRHGVGYLIVAMQLSDAGRDAAAQSAVSFRERIADPDGRRAWDVLELNHEMKLSFEDGWVRAEWRPAGFRFFPGPFDADRWRAVLKHLHTLVLSLERGAAGPPAS